MTSEFPLAMGLGLAENAETASWMIAKLRFCFPSALVQMSDMGSAFLSRDGLLALGESIVDEKHVEQAKVDSLFVWKVIIKRPHCLSPVSNVQRHLGEAEVRFQLHANPILLVTISRAYLRTPKCQGTLRESRIEFHTSL